MGKPVNKKLLAAIGFPVVPIPVNVSALVGSGVEGFDVIMSTAIHSGPGTGMTQ